MIAPLLGKERSAKADLSAEETSSKKGAWFSGANEDSRGTECIESEATQGAL